MIPKLWFTIYLLYLTFSTSVLAAFWSLSDSWMILKCVRPYYTSKPSVSGVIVLLSSKTSNRVSPLHWKSRMIKRITQSSKDAETRACEEGLDHSLMVSQMLERMLFGSFGKNLVEVRAMSDSEPLIRTLGSTKRTVSKAIIPNIRKIKEMLRLGRVTQIKFMKSNKTFFSQEVCPWNWTPTFTGNNRLFQNRNNDDLKAFF